MNLSISSSLCSSPERPASPEESRDYLIPENEVAEAMPEAFFFAKLVKKFEPFGSFGQRIPCFTRNESSLG